MACRGVTDLKGALVCGLIPFQCKVSNKTLFCVGIGMDGFLSKNYLKTSLQSTRLVPILLNTVVGTHLHNLVPTPHSARQSEIWVQDYQCRIRGRLFCCSFVLLSKRLIKPEALQRMMPLHNHIARYTGSPSVIWL